MLRAHSTSSQDMIEFAVPHTLAFTFFPAWVASLHSQFGPFKSRLIALNVHDAVMRLVEGSCDLLIAYHHASQPIQLNADRYEMLPLGQETLSPYVKPDERGQPRFRLPGTAAHPLPYLGYAPSAYMGRAVEQVLKNSVTPAHLDRIYETDMSESLKAMAIEGHGIAFLPASAVRRELRSQRLVRAGEGFDTSMDIRIYRERPGTRKAKGSVETFWRDLQAHLQTGPEN